MSCRFSVKLTQYTPLLHFQGEQEGACLRASEVKPALDNFIADWLQNHPEDADKSWILSEVNRHIAYRYRMTFTPNGEPEHQRAQDNMPKRPYFYMYRTTNDKNKTVVKGDIHRLYFAAMGDDAFDGNGESKTTGVFYPKGMTMTILVPGDRDNRLSDLLKKLIPPFFALHCIGNRSNKGFGSFGVKEINGNPEGILIPMQLAQYAPNQKTLYYVEYGNQACTSHKEYLDDVFMLSQVIKAGLNYTFVNDNSYYKGLIFRYFLDPNKQDGKEIHSEKRFIKDQMLCLGGKKANTTNFVRGIIGLPQNYDYKNFYTHDKDFAVEVSHDVIERYENPIHFKPCGRYLFIIPQIMPDKMLATKFILHSKKKNRSGTVIEEKQKTIQTPSDFNIISFLDYCVSEYDNDRSELIENFENRGATKSIRSSINRVESIKKAKTKEKAQAKAGDKNNG